MDVEQTILIVDDDLAGVAPLRRQLEMAGYRVLIANDGVQAIEMATNLRPNLILLDIMIPGTDGLDICKRLKEQDTTNPIPIIFVAAESQADRIVDALSAGCVDYTTKPFRIDEVIARISVHLRLRKAKQGLLDESAQLKRLAGMLADTNTELAYQSRTDPLTKILNRGAWQESAQLEHERSQRCGHTYSVLMIDVDHFKAYNDTQGHAAGDDCLQKLAGAISSSCRSIDLVGRYGGEEFVVLLPETDSKNASEQAERIRDAIWKLAISHDASPTAERVTASFGVAGSRAAALEDVLKEADVALYAAKDAGRNRVHIGNGSPATRAGVAAERPSAIAVTPQPDRNDVPTVLIVGDNPTNRLTYKKCLAREGFRTREAANGQAAIREAGKELPDVIIMDRMMPVMDGLECARLLKANPDTREVPIIMLAARAKDGDLLAGMEAGVEEYLISPVRTDELAIRVRTMIRIHRRHTTLVQNCEVRGEQTRILTLALDFCHSLGTANGLDEVLERSIAVTSEMAGCRRVWIMLPDADGRFLTVAKSIGVDEETAAGVRVPIGEAIAGRVFQTGRSTVINVEEQEQNIRTTHDTPLFAGVPLFATPLGAAGINVGVLIVTDRCDRRNFSPSELEYIDLIAGVAGSAIHSVLSREARDQARDSIVLALAKLAEHRDAGTGKHLERVTRYSIVLAQKLRTDDRFPGQIDATFIAALERAVLLHDIGKVAIPDHILLKPGKLTDDEMAIMKTHAGIGASTIRSVIERTPGAEFLIVAEEIAAAHHEWFDGSGYPNGLAGDAIPLSARIVAVADAYDALTTRRSYKEPFSHQKSLDIITSSSGTHFDPAIVEAIVASASDFATLALELGDEKQSDASLPANPAVEHPVLA